MRKSVLWCSLTLWVLPAWSQGASADLQLAADLGRDVSTVREAEEASLLGFKSQEALQGFSGSGAKTAVHPPKADAEDGKGGLGARLKAFLGRKSGQDGDQAAVPAADSGPSGPSDKKPGFWKLFYRNLTGDHGKDDPNRFKKIGQQLGKLFGQMGGSIAAWWMMAQSTMAPGAAGVFQQMFTYAGASMLVGMVGSIAGVTIGAIIDKRRMDKLLEPPPPPPPGGQT